MHRASRRALAQAGRPGARSLEAARLAEVAEEAGIADGDRPRPAAAVRRAVAEAACPRGWTLVSGSHYLLGYAFQARS